MQLSLQHLNPKASAAFARGVEGARVAGADSNLAAPALWLVRELPAGPVVLATGSAPFPSVRFVADRVWDEPGPGARLHSAAPVCSARRGVIPRGSLHIPQMPATIATPSIPIPPRAKIGRGCTVPAATRQAILAAFEAACRQGATVRSAARSAGVALNSIRNWQRPAPVRKKPRTNPERTRALARFLAERSAGVAMAAATRRAGASRATLYRWARRGLSPAPIHSRTMGLARALGLSNPTLAVLREERVYHADIPSTLRAVVRSKRCTAAEARILRPFYRRTLPVPEPLAEWLKVRETYFVKIACGREVSVLRPVVRKAGSR